MLNFRFKCTTCSEWHEGLPDLVFAAPHYYDVLSDEQKLTIAMKSDDFCSIDDEDFFIRTILRIPIIGMDGDFAWGVWVSLSRTNFQKYVDSFDSPNRSNDGPYFGWFSNRLPGYPETLALKTHVHLQPYPNRPEIELEETGHPLSVHQRSGISMSALQSIIESNMHPAK